MTTDRPTPRTDAALLRYTGGELVTFPRGLQPTVDADFARALERELAEAREKLAASERDAERYRFLRAEANRIDPVAALVWKWKMNRASSEWANTSCGDSLDGHIDAAIDAARSKP